MTASTEVLGYIQTALKSGQCSAVITQNSAGTQMMSIDIGPGASFLDLPLLQGNAGAAGQSQFPLRLMPDVLDSPADLPAVGTLSNTDADIGKFWIIYQLDEGGACTSTGAYIWFGSEFRFLPFGNQGPPGKYPIIQPYVTLLDPDLLSQPVVSNPDAAATIDDPFLLTMDLSIPAGPQGPSASLASMPDVDESTPPLIGQFLAATGTTVLVDADNLPVYAPADVGTLPLLPYSVPRAAFVGHIGVTFESTVTIAAFTVPPQPFDWKPVIFGAIQLFEVELSLQPLQIGVEVLLGSPNPDVGTLVARGFGNTLSGVVQILPHTSTPSTPTVAMTPGNDVGLVDANTTGPASTIYVNIVNDGIVAVYDYNPTTAEIFVLACPATT